MVYVRLLAVALFVVGHGIRAAENPIGQTRVAKWKDDRKAAFMLFFDDSMPSHVKNVVPELKARGFTATFYANPGKGEWKLFKDKWEKEIPAAGFEYGNHTFTHKGVKDMADAEEEFGKCKDVILGVHPERKNPRLISFGIPGVAKGAWNITDAQRDELLARHHMILRPNVHFGAIHLKTAEEMLKIVDDAIAKGGSDNVGFHGVGGEWLSTPLPVFKTLIAGLIERREKLWISDHISIHKYETERGSAEAQVVEAGDKQIRIKLSCKANPELYDAPLTLITRIPAGWKKVQVSGGNTKTVVSAANGEVQYEALPDGKETTLQAVE